MKIKSEKDADSGKKTKKSRLACKMIKNTQKRKFAFLSSLFFNAIVTLAQQQFMLQLFAKEN